MGSVQGNSPPPAVSAQSNAGMQAQIKATAQQITSLQPQVAGAASQVQSATAAVQADYTALAADPSNKALAKQLADDTAALTQDKKNLDTLTQQLKDAVDKLPMLIAQAQAQAQTEHVSQSIQDEQAKQDQDAETKASDAGDTVSTAQSASAAAQQQLLKKPPANSPGAPTQSQPQNPNGLTEEESSNGNKKLGASQSGSQVDAAGYLAQDGFNTDDPGSLKWLHDQTAGLIKDGIFNAAIKTIKKGQGDDTLGSGSPTGKPGANGKTGGPKLGAAGPTSGGNINPNSLSANEILMLVMLEATDELNKEMQGMAVQLQNATSAKSDIRNQLDQINGQISYSTNLSGPSQTNNDTLKAESTNLQNALSSIGDDTQEMQLRMQNVMQMQQQFMQAVSNISKSLNDTSMAILRHIGS